MNAIKQVEKSSPRALWSTAPELTIHIYVDTLVQMMASWEKTSITIIGISIDPAADKSVSMPLSENLKMVP
jgi:hypothetical protein